MIENPKFLSVIEPNEGSPPLEPFDYSKIENKFIQFINNENNFKGDDKEKLITTLQNVLNKSKRCGNPTGEISSIMNKAVEFAFRQNVRFTEAYIDIFIDETSKAYNTGTDNISCVKGIKERFYTSLLSAALQVGTIEDFPITPEIKILYCIASTGNTQKDPNEILQKWSELWEEKNAEEWKQMSKEEREEHLKQFMLDEYKKDICFEENKKIIKNIIDENVKKIEYVFNNNEYAAQFGGIRQNKSHNKIKKTKKRKNKNKKQKIEQKKTQKQKNLKKQKQKTKNRTKENTKTKAKTKKTKK